MCVTYTRILLSLFFKNLWLQKKKNETYQRVTKTHTEFKIINQ